MLQELFEGARLDGLEQMMVAADGTGVQAIFVAAVAGQGHDDGTARTGTVERVPDPKGIDLDVIWDCEWRENLLRAALDRVKRRVNPAHYEMYHLQVAQGLSARETARALGVSAAAVHLAKHRVGRLVKAELRRLGEGHGQ